MRFSAIILRTTDMSPKYPEYLRKADACRATAALIQDPGMKEAWLKLAGEWLQLGTRWEPADPRPFDGRAAADPPPSH